MILGDVATAVGKGLFAGLAGVAAMTLSQQIEMKPSGREPSSSPGDMVADLLGIEPKGQKERETFSNLVHWTWGAAWGVPRGLIALTGARGGKAVAAHASVILGIDFWILHTLNVAPPPWRWKPEEIALEVLHKSVLALATSAAYEALDR
jgi:hypothetical protein